MAGSSRALALLLVAGALLVSIVPLVHAHDVASAAFYSCHCPFETLAGQAVALVAAPTAPSAGALVLVVPAATHDGPGSRDIGLVLASRAPPPR